MTEKYPNGMYKSTSKAQEAWIKCWINSNEWTQFGQQFDQILGSLALYFTLPDTSVYEVVLNRKGQVVFRNQLGWVAQMWADGEDIALH
jgi:hypothetical protein